MAHLSIIVLGANLVYTLSRLEQMMRLLPWRRKVKKKKNLCLIRAQKPPVYFMEIFWYWATQKYDSEGKQLGVWGLQLGEITDTAVEMRLKTGAELHRYSRPTERDKAGFHMEVCGRVLYRLLRLQHRTGYGEAHLEIWHAVIDFLIIQSLPSNLLCSVIYFDTDSLVFFWLALASGMFFCPFPLTFIFMFEADFLKSRHHGWVLLYNLTFSWWV